MNITKHEFAELLLSRYLQLDDLGRYHIISCLVSADTELKGMQADIQDKEALETSDSDADSTEREIFEGWRDTLVEGIFPEITGELEFKDYGDDEEDDDTEDRGW